MQLDAANHSAQEHEEASKKEEEVLRAELNTALAAQPDAVRPQPLQPWQAERFAFAALAASAGQSPMHLCCKHLPSVRVMQNFVPNAGKVTCCGLGTYFMSLVLTNMCTCHGLAPRYGHSSPDACKFAAYLGQVTLLAQATLRPTHMQKPAHPLRLGNDC